MYVEPNPWWTTFRLSTRPRKFSIPEPMKIVFWGVKASKNEQKFISKIPEFSSFYPKYSVFSSDFTKLRSFGLLLRTKNDPFCPSNYRFFTGRDAFFASILNNWTLKTPKSSYLVWTHCAITAQNIVIPWHQVLIIVIPWHYQSNILKPRREEFISTQMSYREANKTKARGSPPNNLPPITSDGIEILDVDGLF